MVADGVNGKSGSLIKTSEDEGLSEGLSEGLNEGLKKLLKAIQENQGTQAKDLAERLNRPIKTIERQIKTLTDKNLIERRGSKKTGGYWEVILHAISSSIIDGKAGGS